ncbi:MAG: tetratricopeptide repeat protein [Pseudomonadota bacterium]
MLGLDGNNAPAGDLVKDGTDASFMADVIEASREAAVIVDFHAEWCGPCKTLGPALEAAVNAAGGKAKLVKIDIDKNPQYAGQLRVQSIPAVFAFVNGQPVDGFMGNQTPSEIKAFVERAAASGGAGKSEAESLDEAMDAADEMLAAGALGDAAQTFAAVMAEHPENARAIAGLARAYATAGQLDKAKETLDAAPESVAAHALLTAVRAQIELSEQADTIDGTEELEAAVASDPDNHQARYDLAVALFAKGDAEGAVEALLELFRRDREWNDGAAKAQLFKIFEGLGEKSPVALTGRRRLSSMIFA